MPQLLEKVRSAEVVLPCENLDETLRFFTKVLGFRVDEIMPADEPTEAAVSGHGARVRLAEDAVGSPGTLRLAVEDPDAVADGARELTAPNGTKVLLVDADPPVVIPPIDRRFVLTKAPSVHPGSEGRAGMLYRDLIPGRLGGRYIASHIRVPDPGPVPDYVHYHRVELQLIFCHRGWVRVVYEDQGPPFVLEAGDCVLQPPQIRHRVLESSPGMEVVELGCPAEHETHADLELELPNDAVDPDRVWDGQRFVRHQASLAAWAPWRRPGLEARELGIGAATGGLAGAHVVRRAGAQRVFEPHRHSADLCSCSCDGAASPCRSTAGDRAPGSGRRGRDPGRARRRAGSRPPTTSSCSSSLCPRQRSSRSPGVRLRRARRLLRPAALGRVVRAG